MSYYQEGGYMMGGDATSPHQERKEKGAYKARTLPRVTLKQLVSAAMATQERAAAGGSADAIEIDGKEVSQVVFVAQLMDQVQDDNQRIVLRVNDSTAAWNVVMYVEEDSPYGARVMRELSVGAWYQIMAHVKPLAPSGELQVVVTSVHSVRDSNAITHHFLDAYWQHLLATKGHMMQAAGSGLGLGGMYGAAAAGGYGAGAGITLDQGNSAMSMLLEAYNRCEQDRGEIPDEGIVVEDLQPYLAGWDVTNIEGTLEKLICEGMVYTTVDDRHFKRTG